MIDFRISIILLLAMVVLSRADSEVEDQEGNEINCNSNKFEVYDRFLKCFHSENVTGYISHMNGLNRLDVITGEAFLARITSACSDEQISEAYTRCTEDIVSVCPELTEIMHDIVNEKISFLCESSRPSSWIRSVLNEDFMLNTSCINSSDNEMFDIIENCNPRLNNLSEALKSLTLQTLAEERELVKRLTSNWFQCTVLPYYGESYLSCGSKKKVMYLLFGSLTASVRIHLNLLLDMKPWQY